MQIVLYNPFVKHSRKNRADIGVINVYKVVVLFGNPSLTQDYVVAAIYSATNSLAIWKASSRSGKKWIYLEDVRKDTLVDRHYTDVIEYKGLIYARNHQREKNSTEMEQVDNLDGDAIFVGDGKSVCVAASDFRNCEPNSVYFTDDGFMLPSRYGGVHWGPRDTGVFSLEDHSIKSHYPYDDPTQKFLPPAIWITPMF
ncbi:hypothetical protein RND81_06G139300 [Saponaria officinalis]|uniref:KIB1-4 beta-propeller domain-containing protein n=1 Tax=Saponaria officinalis TaxID=3572 RepID=A0AAW1K667_SAPOF